MGTNRIDKVFAAHKMQLSVAFGYFEGMFRMQGKDVRTGRGVIRIKQEFPLGEDAVGALLMHQGYSS